ncbi:MAG: sodium/proline symporter, partial [Nannocystaceae bacterium]
MDTDLLYKLIALIVYASILMGIGVVASRRMKDVRDYFAGGKQLGFWSVAFSARATGESAWLLLGLTGMGAAVGLKAMWVVAGELLGVGLAWMWLAGPFKRLTDRYDSITVPDYLAARFRGGGQGLRLIAAATLVVFVTIFVSAQLDATGQAFEQFLGWNYYTGLLVGFFVVLLYISAGGFLAVVWSDVFQGSLMVAGLTLLPIVGVVYAGGPGQVVDTLVALDPNYMSWTGGEGITPLSVASIISFFAIGLGFLGSPQVFVRFLALRDEREIPKGALVAVVWTILADTGAVLTGMVGRAIMVGDDLGTGSQNVLPLMIEVVFPAFIVGVFIAIVLSAIMSTVDSLLVVAGSAAVRDYYQCVRNPHLSDASLVKASRVATVALALMALLLALLVASLSESRSIFWFVIFGWSGIAATFCPTIILSLCWSRLTALGAGCAMVTGFLCVP